MARTRNGLAGKAPRDREQLMGIRSSFDGVRLDPAGAYGQFEHADCAEQLLLTGRKPAWLVLSYLGTERTLPNYNTMGLAKARLEPATRYLAFCLGPQGIRANAISAGPIKTLAAPGIGNFSRLLADNAHNAPLRRNITIDEVGNAAAFLLSDLASAITAEIMYDDGLNTTALGNPEPLLG